MIKKITKKILSLIVKKLKIEETCIQSGYLSLLPKNTSYKPNSIRKVVRNNINYELDISDYMQWHIFACIDLSFSKRIIENNIPLKSAVIDIGCNVGEFTLQVLKEFWEKKLGGHLYAIDPNLDALQSLKKNISLNYPIAPSITLSNIAIANKEELVDFAFDKNHSGAGKIGSNAKNKITIMASTLDSYVKSNNIETLGFIKIDVEGFEGNVLEGGKQTFNSHRPVCYIEVSPAWLKRNGYSKEYIYNFFNDLSYSIYIDQNNTLIPLSSIGNTPDYQHNILCFP